MQNGGGGGVWGGVCCLTRKLHTHQLPLFQTGEARFSLHHKNCPFIFAQIQLFVSLVMVFH